MNKKLTPELLKNLCEKYKYANHHGCSDVHPFEILEVKGNTITLRGMSHNSNNKVKMNFHVGGFAGHCSNQYDQEYNITSNPDAPVIKARVLNVQINKTKRIEEVDGDYKWVEKIESIEFKSQGMRYLFSKHPIYFYDYNF